MIGVYVSSMLYDVIRTISSLFFLKTILNTQKHLTRKNQLTKQTQASTEQNATIFCAQKLLRGGISITLHFLKKIEIVLITSFTILLIGYGE